MAGRRQLVQVRSANQKAQSRALPADATTIVMRLANASVRGKGVPYMAQVVKALFPGAADIKGQRLRGATEATASAK